jgi:uncharacterized protein
MANPRRIVIAGGSGFIGRALAARLTARGDEVVILSRSPQRRSHTGVREVHWDGQAPGPWTSEIDGAHAVVNLTGKNVNCRYTQRNLAEIDTSRENSVRVIAAAMNGSSERPRVLVQASTTAIYGDAGDRWCDETAPVGDGIPVETATKWERAFDSAITPRTRRVLLRISFVLGREGGVFRTLSAVARCFAGGAAGTGRQYVSWIHIDDLVNVIVRAIDDERMAGVYNVSGPTPVTNDEFMRELRGAVHRPWSPRAPAWLVRLGCFVMRTEPVLALTGRRVVPQRLLDEGVAFEHRDLRATLDALVREDLPRTNQGGTAKLSELHASAGKPG